LTSKQSPITNHQSPITHITTKSLTVFSHTKTHITATMTINLFDATVPIFIHHLQNLSLILTKASKHSSASSLPSSSLIADMKPLTFQIQTCSDVAKGLVHRITGSPLVKIADNEVTFEDMQGRIQKTLEILKGAKREDFEGKDEIEVDLTRMKLSAKNYVFGFVVPNFYFHYTTAYAILRAQGVEIGKSDFLALDKLDL